MPRDITVNCAKCGEPVRIEVLPEETSRQTDGILRVMVAHGTPPHAIVVYIDRYFRVRMMEYPDVFKFDQRRSSEIVRVAELPESLSDAYGEPCYQPLYSYDEVREREKTSFLLDREVLRVICESGIICLSEIRRKVAHLERAMNERIDLAQLQAICDRYVREGLIKVA
ncbi:MAG: hypothetical protein QXS20_09275 [Candidatus Thorarchaeota archaeon]